MIERLVAMLCTEASQPVRWAQDQSTSCGPSPQTAPPLIASNNVINPLREDIVRLQGIGENVSLPEIRRGDMFEWKLEECVQICHEKLLPVVQMHSAVLPLSLYTVVPLHRPIPCSPFLTYRTSPSGISLDDTSSWKHFFTCPFSIPHLD